MIKSMHDTARRRFMSASATAAISWWDHVGHAPKDPIMSVTEAFLSDTSPNKINLGVVCQFCSVFGCFHSIVLAPAPMRICRGCGSFTVQGAYRDDDGRPVILQCVRDGEAKIAGTGFL